MHLPFFCFDKCARMSPSSRL